MIIPSWAVGLTLLSPYRRRRRPWWQRALAWCVGGWRP